MARHLAFAALVCFFLVTSAKKDDKCRDEVENKIGELMQSGKYGGEGAAALGNILKEHDHDGDGHVTEPDIRKVFDTMGVDKDCYDTAKDVIKHLTDMHDHDKNGKISHDEASRYKSSD